MRERKSRKRHDETDERKEIQELNEFRQDSVEFFSKHKKVLCMGGGLTVAVLLLFGTMTYHFMNRTAVNEQIQQQVAEVETTGEIIKITSDEGLTEAAGAQSEGAEESQAGTGASTDASGMAAAAGEDQASKAAAVSGDSKKADSNGSSSAASKADASSGNAVASKASGNNADSSKAGKSIADSTVKSTATTEISDSTQSTSSQNAGVSQTSSAQNGGADQGSSGSSGASLGIDMSTAKLDKSSNGSGTKTTETHILLSNEPVMDASSKDSSDSSEKIVENSGEKETVAETSQQKPESSSDSKSSSVETPLSKKKLTVLVYMIGSSLETKSNLAANSIVTMLSANVDTKDVNIIIETGGTKKFHNISTADQSFDSSKIQRWMVDGTKLKYLGDAGDAEGTSMTSKDTFENFLKYVKKNFPAGRYEAVLWGQAGGPVSGFGYDEVNTSAGQLAVSDIADALGNTDMDLDLMVFDARLMGAMETGYALSSHVDYLIASEDNEYSIGLNYTNWFKGLSSNPSQSAVDQGKQILDDFIKVNKGKGEGKNNVVAVYSVVDLKALKRNTADKLKYLAELLREAEKTEDGRDHLRQSGKEAYEFAASYSYDLVDVCSWLSAIEENYSGDGKDGIDYSEIRSAAKSLKTAIQKTVEVCRYVTPEDDGGVSGLTIYFPQTDTDKEKAQNMISKYEGLSFSTSYQQLIKQYY
ncbi:clostripain-related cysteine peptidase [Oribacterium sp. WCC10]|uniref:clostripain-related cysteine peptidase n=1 Tax=Oribacterium sp. WCC10 TaxID=1855343 RepID=UPI000B23F202|nr:clostripain-related cysteine peptidase [Oribacterium sp. WCC10]